MLFFRYPGNFFPPMKWILAFFAVWNLAGALLRTFRLLIERIPIARRFYPARGLRLLDEASDVDPASSARFRTAVEDLCGRAGIPVPDLFCAPDGRLIAGTRGWFRHQIHLSRGVITRSGDGELMAILAHEIGHIYYRHFAALRLAEIFAAVMYARAVTALWETNYSSYTYLGLWSLLDFTYSMFRHAAGSVTELMADHFAAHRLGLARELSSGLQRAQCSNGATDFHQILSFYPTVRLRVRLLARYAASPVCR
jgi:Zn-dependent protease with chaperone function